MAPASSRDVHVRLWAAARAAAGQGEATVVVDAGSGDPSVADVRRAVLASLPDRPELPRVLEVCSALVGDRPVGARDAGSVGVPEGVEVEFLPPFAGG
jgi:molybdopterin converting factor small subunit